MTLPLAQSRVGTFSLKAYGQLKKIWDQFDALAIGPGLGREKTTQQFVRQVIMHCPKPLIIDADALYALAEDITILLKAKGPRILTPHPGEMSRLTRQSVKEIEASRLNVARDFARQCNCVLLLKGHRTVVASAQGKTYVNKTGNVGMATAGSGDALTGIITSFLGQGIVTYEAACWGAHIHGAAGDQVVKLKFKTGMIASDIIEYIPYAIKKFSLYKRKV
jgi:NAD(P)H-hydrate epimerase